MLIKPASLWSYEIFGRSVNAGQLRSHVSRLANQGIFVGADQLDKKLEVLGYGDFNIHDAVDILFDLHGHQVFIVLRESGGALLSEFLAANRVTPANVNGRPLLDFVVDHVAVIIRAEEASIYMVRTPGSQDTTWTVVDVDITLIDHAETRRLIEQYLH